MLFEPWRRGLIALFFLTFLVTRNVAGSDLLEDPNFIPGTGHGELTPPILPGVTLGKFTVLIEETFKSSPETAGLLLLAVTATDTMVAIALLAVMNTVGVQKKIGDRRKEDKELIARYLARNKVAY